jgi:hypothetical protein
MSMAPVVRVGPHEFLASLGAGGMGEVCRDRGPAALARRRRRGAAHELRLTLSGGQDEETRAAAVPITP